MTDMAETALALDRVLDSRPELLVPLLDDLAEVLRDSVRRALRERLGVPLFSLVGQPASLSGVGRPDPAAPLAARPRQHTEGMVT